MVPLSPRAWVGGAFLALAACGSGTTPPAPPGAAPRGQLQGVVEGYWSAYLQLNPLRATASGDHRYDDRLGNPLAPQFLADSLALERRALAEINGVAAPDEEAALTRDIFRRERELAIEGFTYPAELMPVEPFDAMPQEFALMGSGAGPHPFATPRDYENWLARIDDYVVWTRQAIANMRDGMRRGYLVPRELVEETLPQLQMLGEDAPANVFYQPLRSMPAAIAEPARARLGRRFGAAVSGSLLPAYRELHDFLQTEYLPLTRNGAVLAAVPLGEAWYAFLVREQTGTTLTPDDIHRIGLAEVARRQLRLQAVLAEAGYDGTPQGYYDLLRQDPRFAPATDDPLDAYRALQMTVPDAAAALFEPPPRADFQIRAVEPFRAATAPGISYRGAPPGGERLGVVYVNAADRAVDAGFDVQARFLDAAVPGHHHQFMAQQQNASLPNFRRFGTQAAFVEGWGLYALSLGEELGMYRDPALKFGALLYQLRQAAGLVVDTGVNSKGWSRKQAVQYLRAQMPIDERAANTIVDRCLARPGRALAATIGELRLQELRSRAEQRLGARFDIRAFHAEILRGGAMPLDLLESRIDRWIDRTDAAPLDAAPIDVPP